MFDGDIILIHGKSIGAKLIQFITHSYWNHAAIVVVLDGEPYAVEADISPVIRRFAIAPPDEMAIYRCPGLTPTDRENIKEIALSYLGTRLYDFLLPMRIFWRVGIIRGLKLLLQMILHDGAPPMSHISDKFVVCSELVQEVYAGAGIPLLPDDYLLTPGAIVHLPQLEQVY